MKQRGYWTMSNGLIKDCGPRESTRNLWQNPLNIRIAAGIVDAASLSREAST